MQLHRLNETFPAICRGPQSVDIDFNAYSAALRHELIYLEHHAETVELSGFCPLDLLLLFHPERRLAVLNGDIRGEDWRHAAAVRMAMLYLDLRAGPDFDACLSSWNTHPLLRSASGPAEFVRGIFSGKMIPEHRLVEKTVLNGVTVHHFIAKGSTSIVYAGELHGRSCVLKLPLPGAETRFRNELELLQCLHHPNLPHLIAVPEDASSCILERCKTGHREKDAKILSGFLNALDYLHHCGILHGDIRRSNLGIRADGTPVLFDFSHARRRCCQEDAVRETEKMRALLA